MTDDRLTVRSGNTHLYRGATLAAGIPADDLGASPRGLRVVFRDGVEVNAELLQSDRGELAVDAPGYRTAAGTDIPAKLWRVSAVEHEAGSALRVDGAA